MTIRMMHNCMTQELSMFVMQNQRHVEVASIIVFGVVRRICCFVPAEIVTRTE